LPEIDFVVWSGRAQLVMPGFIRNSAEAGDHSQSGWSIVVRGQRSSSAPTGELYLRHHTSSNLRRRALTPLLMLSANSAGNAFGERRGDRLCPELLFMELNEFVFQAREEE
jgi:hypothetical protein